MTTTTEKATDNLLEQKEVRDFLKHYRERHKNELIKCDENLLDAIFKIRPDNPTEYLEISRWDSKSGNVEQIYMPRELVKRIYHLTDKQYDKEFNIETPIQFKDDRSNKGDYEIQNFSTQELDEMFDLNFNYADDHSVIVRSAGEDSGYYQLVIVSKWQYQRDHYTGVFLGNGHYPYKYNILD